MIESNIIESYGKLTLPELKINQNQRPIEFLNVEEKQSRNDSNLRIRKLIDYGTGRSQIRSNFISAQEYRQNFNIKIQSSKAFLDSEQSYLQDILAKIEKEKSFALQESTSQQMQRRQSKQQILPTQLNNKQFQNSIIRGHHRSRANISCFIMPSKNAEANYSYQAQNGPFQQYNAHDITAGINILEEFNGESQAILKAKKVKKSYSVLKQVTAKTDEIVQQVPFTINTLKHIKQSVNQQDIMGRTIEAFNKLPYQNQNEAIRILTQNDSQVIKVIQEDKIRPEQLLRNQVKYSFTIDAFDENIALYKKPLYEQSQVDIFTNRNHYVIEENEVEPPKGALSTMTILGIRESGYLFVHLTKQQRQNELQRRAVVPIFSGNLDTYQVNAVTEVEVVRKGRRLSTINFNNFNQIQQQLLNLRQVSLTQLQSVFTKEQESPNKKSGQKTISMMIKSPIEGQYPKIQNVLVKEIKLQNGPRPSCREQLGAAVVENRMFYVFGGVGQYSFNDLKMLTTVNNGGKWEWTSLSLQDAKDAPHKRFGHTLTSYKNSLIVFGGGGQYIAKIKRRETFNDVFKFDLSTSQWTNLTDFTPSNYQNNKAVHQPYSSHIHPSPTKRMGHGSAVLGCNLISYGGVYGEEGNKVLSDFCCFDLEMNQWVRMKQANNNKVQLGPLAYLSMTKVVDSPAESIQMDSHINSRQLWIKSAVDFYNGLGKNNEVSKKYQYEDGIYIFGGLNDKKQAQNELYLLQPEYQSNRKYISIKTGGEFKKLLQPKYTYQLTKLNPSGRGPCARYLHSAALIKYYVAIFGGRNDDMYGQFGNIALNDLHLYDLIKNQWTTIAMYGQILPHSRWGHQIVSGYSDGYQDTLLLLGGINLTSYCESNIFQFILGKDYKTYFNLFYRLDDKAVAYYLEDHDERVRPRIQEEDKKL